MAKFTQLEMAKVLSKDSRIDIRKSLFGILTTAVYIPTGSKLDVFRNDYNTGDGETLKQLFACSEEQLAGFLKKCPTIEPAAMGPARLEGCISDNHQFAALQLFGYSDFSYLPLSEVRIFEGAAAELISTII